MAGTDVKQMSCNHVFHQDCLLPWLHMYNSCPVCRFELPTDDPDYETRAHTTGDPVQGQQRRFSIQLPWPFRREDASGSGTGPTRQEDLD
ncbi:hypothetical protein AALP_AA3G229500 [Arabis alpina]|uniref:RING-type E3 ubiquitin transferase n=1 Tax=Arabis alpina TaxID=50452 RepID=A0A087HB21_ARAAL|nr:hypothetical protein AALP_AA3G229500 [Arabis alpina]